MILPAGKWVESVGLPGVGKTTAILENREELQQGFSILETRNAGAFTLLIGKLLYHFSYKHRVNDRKLAQKIAYRRSFQIFLPKSRPVIFFDSGLVQVVIENLIESGFANLEQKIIFLGELITCDALVYFHDDILDIVKREASRPSRRFPRLDQKELEERYRRAVTLMEERVFPMFVEVITIDAKNIKQPEEA